MKQSRFKTDTIVGFLSNLLSVILGIVITFSVQGMINRSGDKKEIRSALELVRTELAANAEDIAVMADYLVQERKSAGYLLRHREDFALCPEDSVAFHSGILFADASITLSRDALELMTRSSMFQKVGDNNLSMKIIRAYDACQSAAANLNQHIAMRDSRLEGAVSDENTLTFSTEGLFDLAKFLKTEYGLYTVRWLSTQADPLRLADVSDIEDAITAIEKYLE